MNDLLNLPEISQNEFLTHIEDDDFFRVYGNPVMVNCDDGGQIVCMAIEYYDRKKKLIDEMKEK